MTTPHPDAAVSTTIDVTGLPEHVIRSLIQLVDSLRTLPTPPKPSVPDPLTEARDEFHREIMESFEKKWAMYGPYHKESK